MWWSALVLCCYRRRFNCESYTVFSWNDVKETWKIRIWKETFVAYFTTCLANHSNSGYSVLVLRLSETVFLGYCYHCLGHIIGGSVWFPVKTKLSKSSQLFFFIQVVIYLNQRKDMFLSTFYTHQFNKFISCWLRSCILICILWGSQIRKLWTCIYRVSVGRPEGKRPLERPKLRWEDNINLDLQDVGLWTGLSWLRIGTGGGLLWLG